MNCGAMEIRGECNCPRGAKCSWRVFRYLTHCSRIVGPVQLIEIDAREAGAPGWTMRVEEAPNAGWLAHIKHQATGNMVPAGPQTFPTRDAALAECLRLAAL